MNFISKILWALLFIILAVGYYKWFVSYNSSLEQWGPIIQECSDHGGHMDSTGTCVFE